MSIVEMNMEPCIVIWCSLCVCVLFLSFTSALWICVCIVALSMNVAMCLQQLRQTSSTATPMPQRGHGVNRQRRPWNQCLASNMIEVFAALCRGVFYELFVIEHSSVCTFIHTSLDVHPPCVCGPVCVYKQCISMFSLSIAVSQFASMPQPWLTECSLRKAT